MLTILYFVLRHGGIKMKKILVVLLLVMMIVPAAIAEDVIVQKISAEETCVVHYDIITQQEIVDCPVRPRIDVVFVVDSTGSMGDEIRSVKTHLNKIIKEVQNGQPKPDLRVGVVAYRDHEREEEEYLLRRMDLTYDIEKAIDFIWNIKASGGGDLPEAVADGLDFAINDMSWDLYHLDQNQNSYPHLTTKRLIFLIGDAAPHGVGSSDYNYGQGCPEGHSYKENIKDAQNKDIVIYTISGSGIDSVGKKVFKTIADKTGGEYTHLSYSRQNVQEYYEDEGFEAEEVQAYVKEASKDVDYDRASNSILTNTLGQFTKSAMKAEAMDVGVEYDREEPIVTGNAVVDVEEESSLGDWFSNIFDRIAFWR